MGSALDMRRRWHKSGVRKETCSQAPGGHGARPGPPPGHPAGPPAGGLQRGEAPPAGEGLDLEYGDLRAIGSEQSRPVDLQDQERLGQVMEEEEDGKFTN